MPKIIFMIYWEDVYKRQNTRWKRSARNCKPTVATSNWWKSISTRKSPSST